MPQLVEVIVENLEDALAAAAGGAGRLEVARDIPAGGLTPPADLVRAIQEATALPIRVMVRENAGFTLEEGELARLQRAAREFTALRVDGIVMGFAVEGRLRLDDLARVLEAAPDARVTIHRAFDSLRDPLAAIDLIAAVPQVDRIMTSGGAGPAAARCERLAQYQARAGGRLTIVAGGEIEGAMLDAVLDTRCVREIHVGRAVREGASRDGRVSIERVRELSRRALTPTSPPSRPAAPPRTG